MGERQWSGTNKYDWNRLPSPNTQSYGTSGINISYMRISDVYLMLAEVYAALGDDGKAKTYLGIVHHRAFQETTILILKNISPIAVPYLMPLLKNVH